MYYSGVSLGLMHGCMPDYLILTHEPERNLDVTKHPIPELRQLVDLHLDLMRPFKNSKFLGVNLITLQLSNNLSKKTIDSLSSNLNLPVTDIIRWRDRKFIDHVENSIFG